MFSRLSQYTEYRDYGEYCCLFSGVDARREREQRLPIGEHSSLGSLDRNRFTSTAEYVEFVWLGVRVQIESRLMSQRAEADANGLPWLAWLP